MTYTNALQDIIDFVRTSASCKQFTRIDCYNMVIFSRKMYTFLMDRDHKAMDYIGGGPPSGSGMVEFRSSILQNLGNNS